MSSGTQVDLDWAGIDPTSPNGGYVGQGAAPAGGSNAGGTGTARYLTDEEILGIDPVQTKSTTHGDVIPSETRNPSSIDDAGGKADSSSSRRGETPRNDSENVSAAGQGRAAQMPGWLQTLAGDPQHGAEAQQLWQEHQEFCAAFSSPAEAQALKQASKSVERIDAAIFSGDARAQSEVVAELARANPAAFRTLFSEAARVLAGMGGTVSSAPSAGPTLRESGEGWGTRQTLINGVIPNEVRNPSELADGAAEQSKRDSSSGLNDGPPRNDVREGAATQSPTFDPVAYSNFERTTNDAVARDVRTTIGDTLSRVLPDGVAEGAARRIGDDIFNEIHRALAADRALSEQVAGVLRVPLSSGQAALASGQNWRFGNAEQQRVTALLAGRARQLVPSVARRVIGEWTSSVLGTARNKAARQAAAASRVDIAAAGGSLDSMPLRAMSPREVDYASMSDDEILGM